MTRPRYAIIPSNGRKCLDQAIEAIYPQVDRVLVTWTGDWENRRTLPFAEGNKVLYSIWSYRHGADEPANISAWWNNGLESARDISRYDFPDREAWDVAVLNDDAIVPEGWFDAVSTTMREYGAAAACSCGPRATQLFTEPGPIAGNSNPMEGFAFILAGEKGLRANEDLHWYFSDNYIDWESRKLGGMVAVSGWPVRHLHANAQMGHDLIARVPVDAQNFVDLYGGMRPW
jgi:hypothetical protein